MSRQHAPSRTLWILEPDLYRLQGHHVPYALSIGRAARERGWRVGVACSARVEPAVWRALSDAGFRVEPVFPQESLWLDTARVVRQLRRGIDYGRGLRAVGRHFAPGDLAFTFSGEREFGVAAGALARAGGLATTLVMQFFWWDPHPAKAGVAGRLNRVFGAGLDRAMRRLPAEPIRVVGQGDAFASILSRRAGRRVAALPFPIAWDELPDIREPAVELPPTVAYLGSARPDKGFGAFAEALTYVRGAFRGVAQTFRIFAGPDPAHDEGVRRLRAIGCECLDQPLDEAAYAALLGRIDIIVLPYDPALYAERTSGLLAEALGMGMLVVAPSGTWLGDELDALGLGVTYAPYTPVALAGAIDRAISGRVALSDASRAVAPGWRERNCAAALVDRLFALIDGASEPVVTAA